MNYYTDYYYNRYWKLTSFRLVEVLFAHDTFSLNYDLPFYDVVFS